MNEISPFDPLPVPPELAAEFFAHNESLAADAVRAGNMQRRRAWWIAGAACFVAVVESFAIASLAPLHTVEWRLVRVDASTGRIDEVSSLRAASATITEANVKALLDRYVMLREGYAAPEATYNFRAVSLMSGEDEQKRYAAEFGGKNPLSPQVVFGKSGYIRVRIKTVAVLGPRLGQVRFAREEVKDRASPPKITHWQATIGFDVRPDARMSNADRLLNPIGFLVSDYHVDPDQP